MLTDHFESTLEGTMACGGGGMWLWRRRSDAKLFYGAGEGGVRTIFGKTPRRRRWGAGFSAAGRTTGRGAELYTGDEAGYGGEGVGVSAGRWRGWARWRRREGWCFSGTWRDVCGGGFEDGDAGMAFRGGQPWRASPMTYMVGGKQYVVLAGQGGVMSFALTP